MLVLRLLIYSKQRRCRKFYCKLQIVYFIANVVHSQTQVQKWKVLHTPLGSEKNVVHISSTDFSDNWGHLQSNELQTSPSSRQKYVPSKRFWVGDESQTFISNG